MNNLVLTGPPGIGKTTVMTALAKEVSDLRPSGFITEEIREGGRRRGFSLSGLDGRRGVLAHEEIRSPHRVGRYGVDLPAFETFLEEAGLQGRPSVVLIDEIGKMECLSPIFVSLVKGLLDADGTVVATLAQKGGGFLAAVRERRDVELVHLDHRNRDELPRQLAARVRRWTSRS